MPRVIRIADLVGAAREYAMGFHESSADDWELPEISEETVVRPEPTPALPPSMGQSLDFKSRPPKPLTGGRSLLAG